MYRRQIFYTKDGYIDGKSSHVSTGVDHSGDAFQKLAGIKTIACCKATNYKDLSSGLADRNELVFPAYGEEAVVVFRAMDSNGTKSTRPKGVTWRALNLLNKSSAASLIHFLLHANQHCFTTAYFELHGPTGKAKDLLGELNPAILDLLTTIQHQRPFRIHALEVGTRYAHSTLFIGDYLIKPSAESYPLPEIHAVATAMQFLNFRHITTYLSTEKASKILERLTAKEGYRALTARQNGSGLMHVLFQTFKEAYNRATADVIVNVSLLNATFIICYRRGNFRSFSSTTAI